MNSYHPPHILLITTDQLRWDFYDRQTVKNLQTPALDRLRADGAVLPNTFANCPICMPARMTWTHGLYPSQVAEGLLHNWHSWPRHLCSMPQVLQQAGYHTALIGKLHAQGRWHNDLTDPVFVEEAKGRGYTDVFEVCGKSFAHDVDCHWTHYLKDKGLLEAYRRDLERRVESIGGDEPSDSSFLPLEDHMDSFVGRHACSWLEAVDSTQPFFLHASFCGPHFPIDPPKEYHRLYTPEDMPVPVGVDDPDRIRYWQRRTAAYCGMITHVDSEVGKLLDLLDARGLTDQTLVLFTTDHGDMMGHHDQAHKGPFYDTSARTPMILRWPGKIAAGTTLDGMIESVDLPISIMAAAGVEKDPGDCLPSTPGRSFMEYVTAKAPQSPRNWTYTEMGHQLCGGYRMCREKDWKYVFFPNGEDHLYDMKNDPWERCNLIHEPVHAERISRMRAQLLESMQHVVTPSRWKMGDPTYEGNQYLW